jgi:hypothetical protein
MYLYEPLFLSVVCPDLRVQTGVGYVRAGWIYTGKERIVGDSSAFWLVSNSAMAEIKITNREELIRYVYTRMNKKCPASVVKHVLKITKEELIIGIKLCLILGRWVKTSNYKNFKIYELFNCLCESKIKFLTTYFNLRKHYSFNYLFSSILTFFQRVINYDANCVDKDITMSNYYNNVIMKFKNQSTNLKSITNLILGNHFDEITVLNFIMDIRV